MPPAAASPPVAVPQAAPPSYRRRRRAWGGLALLGVGAVFIFGIARLFDLRFSTGDVYAHYSTLRSDPLGTKALYYSLQELPGLRVERNVRPLRYLGEEPSAVLQHRDDDPDPSGKSGPVAVFYLGESVFAWPYLLNESETVRLETLMNRGGRVILAFQPTTVGMTSARLDKTRRDQIRDVKQQAGEEEKKAADKDKENEKNKDKDKKLGKSGPSPGPGSAPSPSLSPSRRPTASPTPSPSPSPSPKKSSPAPVKGKEDKLPAPPDTAPGDSPASEPEPSPAPSLSKAEKLFAKEDLIRRWHVDFQRTPRPGSSDKKKSESHQAPAPLDETAQPVPDSPAGFKPVSWHTNVDFDLVAHGAREAGWRALYTRSGRPVIAERPFGSAGGKLIVVSDPYFFSNEALSKEPHPALLAALVGPCRRIIFDETHLGITENPGMMTLARRYHLQGALAALAVLAALFLWKNMVGLVPPPVEDRVADNSSAGNFVTGRDSAEGFVNLLRRSVSPRDLLRTCLTQWSAGNAMPGARQPGADVVARLNAISAEDAAKPIHRRALVAAYQAMCAAVKLRGVVK